MKSKRGQGLPMNTIVIAAIVLVVMVVLIYIFVGGMSQTTNKLGSCEEKGGECLESCPTTHQNIGELNCKDEDKVCCLPVPPP